MKKIYNSNLKEIDASNDISFQNFVVLDLETTGINVINDRIVEVGVLQMEGEKIQDRKFLEFLVNPQTKISKLSTSVHGITEEMVQEKKTYKGLHKIIHTFLEAKVVVGFNIGFDLAMLRKESLRAGFEQRDYRWVDVKYLSIHLGISGDGISLDSLSEKMEVKVSKRHRAMGDVKTTARIFAKMIPLLKKNDIRTLAQIERLTQNHLSMLDSTLPKSWYYKNFQPSKTPSYFFHDRRKPNNQMYEEVERLDPFPFKHTIKEVMKTSLVTCDVSEAIKDVIKKLKQHEIGGIVLLDKKEPKKYNFLSERQIIHLIAKEGIEVYDKPISNFFNIKGNPSKPNDNALSQSSQASKSDTKAKLSKSRIIDQNDYLYQGMERMQAKKVNHLLAINRLQELVGIVSGRDLLGERISNFSDINEVISSATDGKELAKAFSTICNISKRLMREKLSSINIARIISSEIINITEKAVQIALAKMVEIGKGQPPRKFAVIVLGSGGRKESLLATDQDNAIIFENDPNDENASLSKLSEDKKWFLQLGGIINEVLDTAGIALCKGGIMAGKEKWCKSFAEWESQILKWINSATEEAILNADIFYDYIFAYGKRELSYKLKIFSYKAISKNINFLKVTGQSILQNQPNPLRWWGTKLASTDGMLDIKMNLLFPIIAISRLLAMKAGYYEQSSTPARLKACERLLSISSGDVERMESIFKFALNLLLKKQLSDLEIGNKLGKKVALANLPKVILTSLKQHLNYLTNLDSLIQIAISGDKKENSA